MERKQLVAGQIRQIEKARLEELKQAPKTGPNLMVLVLVRVIGIGIETADMLVKGDLVTQFAGPARCGALRRPHGLARRERQQAPPEGACQIRQRSGAAGYDPTRLAFP